MSLRCTTVAMSTTDRLPAIGDGLRLAGTLALALLLALVLLITNGGAG